MRDLLQQLHCDGALTGHHVDIVIRRDEDLAGLLRGGAGGQLGIQRIAAHLAQRRSPFLDTFCLGR